MSHSTYIRSEYYTLERKSKRLGLPCCHMTRSKGHKPPSLDEATKTRQSQPPAMPTGHSTYANQRFASCEMPCNTLANNTQAKCTRDSMALVQY